MHVERIDLTNIRCFESASLTLSPSINLIVGENNSGKSTVIRSIYMLQAGLLGPSAARYGAQTGTIQIWIANPDFSRFISPTKDFLSGVGQKPWHVLVTLMSQTSSVAFQVISDVGHGQYAHFPNAQPNNFLVPYLSERRFGGFSESITAQVAFALGSLNSLIAKIDTCFSSPELGPLYRDACQAVLGFVATTWPTPAGKMAGLELDPRRHQYIPITEMGAGVGQALGLIVELLVAEDKVFLLEEPETDLHPRAIRALLKLVEKSAASGNQFVVSTHSNVVVQMLGVIEGTHLWRTERKPEGRSPLCTLIAVQNDHAGRRAALESLGYDLSDYDVYDAWLILEESSAERIIREFIIPWFAPGLAGRLRPVPARGAQDVPRRFDDLHRLFVFVHLEPVYRDRAWAITDGDAEGRAAVAELRRRFPTWRPDHFQSFDAHDFEAYYPPSFSRRVAETIAIADRQDRRRAKAELTEEVVAWLREDPGRGREALHGSARDVIIKLQAIEQLVTARH